MSQHDNVEHVIKYRSDKFKREYGEGYVNPFANPRYKELFRAFETVVEFNEFRVETKENGDPMIIIEPINVGEYKKKYKELDEFPFESDESMMNFLNWTHEHGREDMNCAIKKIKKYNITWGSYSVLPAIY